MSTPIRKIIFASFVAIAFVGAIYLLTLYYINNRSKSDQNVQPSTQVSAPQTNTPSFPEVKPLYGEPIANAKNRILKKPFGIYITPATSPVQPEHFTGYHTGTDFEVTNQEITQDIPVLAVCDGKILVKKWVSGYGGVVVQTCNFQDQAVTILYGHLNISENTSPAVGSNVMVGERLAMLGAQYGHDTDGERKHLHLGIHKGTAVDYRGYVVSKSDLSEWIATLGSIYW
jgi:hypothetical protein